MKCRGEVARSAAGRLAAVTGAFSAAMALAGCYDELAGVHLTNNSGQPVVLVERAAQTDAQGRPLAAGAVSGRITAYGTGRRFDIRTKDCVYRYVFPPMGVNYAWRTPDGSQPDYSSHFPVLAQLEPDFRIYLLPPGTKVVLSGEPLAAAQAHGFPLTPVDSSCQSATLPR